MRLQPGLRWTLFGYAKRTVDIASRPFFPFTPDRRKRAEEIKQSVQEAFEKDEAKVIGDLQRRIVEVE